MTRFMNPSIKDVAARAGVSKATVSNVVANRSTVNHALAERVRAAIRELGYVANPAASQLRTGRSRVVAVLVPSLEAPFFTSIIASIERHLRRDGYDIIVGSSNDDEQIERARLAALLSWRPLGVVVVPCTDSFANRSLIEGTGVPYVVADRVIEDSSGGDVVAVDNASAGALAAEHLVSRGHSDVLVVATTLKLANIRERCAGIREVMTQGRKQAPKVLEVGFSLEQVSDQFERYIERGPCPTAVIALTSFSTLGVMAALSQRGLRVPDQVSLVGFDDYVWMKAANPSITAIRQPVDQIGAESVKQLRARIRGDRSAPKRLRLSCELIERNSTRVIEASVAKLPRQAKRGK